VPWGVLGKEVGETPSHLGMPPGAADPQTHIRPMIARIRIPAEVRITWQPFGCEELSDCPANLCCFGYVVFELAFSC